MTHFICHTYVCMTSKSFLKQPIGQQFGGRFKCCKDQRFEEIDNLQRMILHSEYTDVLEKYLRLYPTIKVSQGAIYVKFHDFRNDRERFHLTLVCGRDHWDERGDYRDIHIKDVAHNYSYHYMYYPDQDSDSHYVRGEKRELEEVPEIVIQLSQICIKILDDLRSSC